MASANSYFQFPESSASSASGRIRTFVNTNYLGNFEFSSNQLWLEYWLTEPLNSHKQSFMKKLFLLLFFFGSLAAPAQTRFTLDALKDSLQKIMDKEHMPGLMIALVQRDSVIWQGGLGSASLENKT